MKVYYTLACKKKVTISFFWKWMSADCRTNKENNYPVNLNK